MDRPQALVRRAVAAAETVAREVGLRCTEPVVLSARGNAVVHLAPAPVVARVSTLTAWTRRDPAAWLRREVAVAATAAANGGPVVPPTDLAHPGPYLAGGLSLTLWRHVTVSPERAPAPAAGEALAALHDALQHHAEPLPRLTVVHDLVTEGLAALHRHRAVDAAVLNGLRRVHAEILRDLPANAGPAIVLHGDAHPGNLLRVGDRWLWTDLEETCTGPRAWDLAVLSNQSGSPADGAAAVLAYAAAAGVPVPTPQDLAPFVRARHLEGTVWVLGMAHQYPDRYAGIADGMLRLVLQS
ncbi:MAG TPA: phosphotransferase [Pseudonocardiaceae bacterium]|jgi:hypothetical protein